MARGVTLPEPSVTRIPSSAEVASDYLRTLVFTGVLRSGHKVPVDDVAAALGMSRQPVREALIELAHDGLVDVNGRLGTFVADFGPQVIRDHYELYGLLHGYAVRRVTSDADPETLAQLRSIAEAASARSDAEGWVTRAIEFFGAVNRAAGNGRLRRVIGSMARFTPGEYYLTEVIGAAEQSRASLRDQLEAIESGDPDAAAELVMDIWADAGGRLIDHLTATGVFASETGPTTGHPS